MCLADQGLNNEYCIEYDWSRIVACCDRLHTDHLERISDTTAERSDMEKSAFIRSCEINRGISRCRRLGFVGDVGVYSVT